jgi:HEAT repeat protein
MKNISQFNKYLQCATLALAFTTSLTTSISHAQSAAPASLVQLKQLAAETSQSPEGRYRIEMAKKVSDAISGMTPDQKRAIDDQVVDEIAGLFADKNDGVRYYAAISLGNIGHRAARAVPALRAVLSLVSPTPANTIGSDIGSAAAIPVAIRKIDNDKP